MKCRPYEAKTATLWIQFRTAHWRLVVFVFHLSTLTSSCIIPTLAVSFSGLFKCFRTVNIWQRPASKLSLAIQSIILSYHSFPFVFFSATPPFDCIPLSCVVFQFNYISNRIHIDSKIEEKNRSIPLIDFLFYNWKTFQIYWSNIIENFSRIVTT